VQVHSATTAQIRSRFSLL